MFWEACFAALIVTDNATPLAPNPGLIVLVPIVNSSDPDEDGSLSLLSTKSRLQEAAKEFQDGKKFR